MLTKEQAIAIAESGIWELWDAPTRAEFQLLERKLCMPFEKFHEAVEVWLGRPVGTHEFADPASLLKEGRKQKAPRSWREIMDLIPKDKRIVLQFKRD